MNDSASNDSFEREEFWRLVKNVCQRAPTDVECARLEHLLSSDLVLRKQYVEYRVLHAELEWLYRSAEKSAPSSKASVPNNCERVGVAPASSTAWSDVRIVSKDAFGENDKAPGSGGLGSSRRRRRWVPWLAGMGAAMLLFAAFYFGRDPERQTSASSSGDFHGSELSDEELAAADGATSYAGYRLGPNSIELNHGLATVEFAGGARLTLQSPFRLVAAGPIEPSVNRLKRIAGVVDMAPIIIDFNQIFGAPTLTETSPEIDTRFYNNLGDATEDELKPKIANLIDINNKPTGISVYVTDSFNNDTAPSGEPRSPLYPRNATFDYFWLAGRSDAARFNPTGELLFRGLVPHGQYRLSVFASRDDTNVEAPRIGIYTAIGSNSVSAKLDAVGNLSNMADLNGVIADSNGEIRLKVSIEDSSPVGQNFLAYLNVLEIQWVGTDGS